MGLTFRVVCLWLTFLAPVFASAAPRGACEVAEPYCEAVEAACAAPCETASCRKACRDDGRDCLEASPAFCGGAGACEGACREAEAGCEAAADAARDGCGAACDGAVAPCRAGCEASCPGGFRGVLCRVGCAVRCAGAGCRFACDAERHRAVDACEDAADDCFQMAGRNADWYHLGGRFSGNCAAHDGDVVRRLAAGPDSCFDYTRVDAPGPMLPREVCGNDDDGDGRTDCADVDCDADPECQVRNRADCESNPLWRRVDCATADWVWTSNRASSTLGAAAENRTLFTGDLHTADNRDGLCSLDGTGWVTLARWSMQGCNASWAHIGGRFSGNCAAHDGDLVRRLVLEPDGCYDPDRLPPPGPLAP
jgi:hypothetical protein